MALAEPVTIYAACGVHVFCVLLFFKRDIFLSFSVYNCTSSIVIHALVYFKLLLSSQNNAM